MNDRLSILGQRYLSKLKKFTSARQEADLEEAYALGRKAMAEKFGVLDMARIHQSALNALLPSLPPLRQKATLSATEVFFLESLSPFEATHRGFHEANRRLHRMIGEQEKRNHQLADINARLKEEIRRRKQSESALRASERHLRKLFNEAHAMEEGLRSLSNQVLDMQEAERKLISRELHDETGQALTAISVTLADLGRAEHSIETRRRKLHEAQRLLETTMVALHNFARELRPAMLDELGLLPTLRSYLTSFAERTGLRIHFRANQLAETLAANAKVVLFRVAQESLTNVAKHAKASSVEVSIRKTHHRISMSISDDGASFRKSPVAVAKDEQRLGLLGMQERVRLVNGHFAIRPRLGHGTTVNVTIPLSNGSLPARRNLFSARRVTNG